MSRRRHPSHGSSPYITPQGYRRLEIELKSLWIRRKEVTLALAAAAAEGDRSENAEYIYRKKELREIDRRIRYLQVRMPVLNIVNGIQDRSRVYFGAKIRLVSPDDANEFSVRIVGADELDVQGGHISVDSPLAHALLGKQTHDLVEYHVMEKRYTCIIIDIDYPHTD